MFHCKRHVFKCIDGHTAGNPVSHANTQPFADDEFVFDHNGLIDDFRALTPGVKFIGQILAAGGGQIAQVLDRIGSALEVAHQAGIIHRDIKPGNIIYNPDTGGIKITDFGIAKISDDSRTRTGAVMGSPLYMSPEQLKGQKVTGASDIYSLGITLYKLVSGGTPYQGDTLANLTYQILNKRPRSVREFNAELPNGVVRLINKAIQREPDKRFASAATMAEAVRRLAVREAKEEIS